MSKILILFMCTSVFSYRPDCDEKSVLQHLRVSTDDFSVRLLDRVSQETNGHFVFSPISTWLQLMALSEGAKGKTLNEILRLMGANDTVCYGDIARKIFNSLDDELSETIKLRSIFVIDELLNVKDNFVSNVEALEAASVIPVNFKNASESAAKINKIINTDTNGIFLKSIDIDDFIMSVLLVADVAYVKANWLNSFNHGFTTQEVFYSHEKVPIGYVNMMQQTGSFHLVDIPNIHAQALELPFTSRLSMIFILPHEGPASSLFLTLKETKLTSIVTLLKSDEAKLVNVKIPRFNITTTTDNIPELLNDMDTNRIFFPRFANFKKISDYNVFVSLMRQNTNIEVTETGVTVNLGPQLLVKYEDIVEFSLNRPFAYLLVDDITGVILFAGIYSNPSLF